MLAHGLSLVHFLGHDVWHWRSGNGYQFWSGIAGELTLLGAAIAVVKHHNCHVRGCWRVGRHSVDGTPYKVCRRHHPRVPDGGATIEDIHEG